MSVIHTTVDDDPGCDVLIFFCTRTEKEKLQEAADTLGIPFVEKRCTSAGAYYSLGTVGTNRINAVETEMGAFGRYGSAAQAIIYKTAMGATSIVQIGMAFGIDRSGQQHGDVLVSEFPISVRLSNSG